jgi:hypothetical protein
MGKCYNHQVFFLLWILLELQFNKEIECTRKQSRQMLVFPIIVGVDLFKPRRNLTL